ncbi:MAG: transposase [Proteobacteria bacterium]|nr:transposase [Pseudomonadota bacterium]
MEQRYGMAGRIWVMDRGMTSKDNVAWLQRTGRRYLIGATKQELKKCGPHLQDARDWKQVRDGIEAKICPKPDGTETFLLVRSTERRSQGTSDARAICQAHRRRAGEPDCQAGLRVEWTARPEWDDWSRCSEGCYVLRTNVGDWTPQQLWGTYIQLTEAEAAFRIHKTELSLRPIWHQRPDRVNAHILVCFLAYMLWKTLEQWQIRAGLGNSPRTILDELGTIQSTDVILPLATKPEREIRLRCVVRPDRSQAALLDHLGLRLPKRLQPRIP